MPGRRDVMEEMTLTVQTLLQMCSTVLVVDHASKLLGVWNNGSSSGTLIDKLFEGQIINSNSKNYLLQFCSSHITEAFISKKKYKGDFVNIHNPEADNYTITIIPPVAGKDYLFVLIDQYTTPISTEKADDIWKLALDAAGDGIWDVHLDKKCIFFSEKWPIFLGYALGELTTIDDWNSKIHPDDLIIARENFLKHQNGETPFYSCELRYRCKDGTYKWILSRGMIVTKSTDGKPLRSIGTYKDITERKLMEDERLANLSLFLKLMNSLPSGILVTDENKKLIFANKAFCNLYGLNKHPRELMGIDTEESLKSDKLYYKDPDAIVSRIQQILKDRIPVWKDELQMADGRIISRDYIPLNFRENHTGEIWKFTDITEQKNINKRFEQQRLFYEQILNGIQADIAVHDAQHRFLFINPKAIKDEVFRKWLIGKTHEDYCAYRNRPLSIAEERNRRFDLAVKEKRLVIFEEKIDVEGKPPVYQLRCLFPTFKENGELDIVIVYGVDITERKKIEEELQTSMDTFANSFNYSGIGKALITLNGHWQEVNDVLCQLTGYTREEMTKMHQNDITFPDDIDLDKSYNKQLLNNEITSYSIEKRFISRTRQIISISLTVSLVRNSDGSPKYFICDLIDVTSKKLLSDELNRQNAELRATKTNLINKIHQLEELSHMIAHNLRGPANNIKMLSERLIIDDNDPRVEDEVFTKDEAGSIIHESSIALTNSLNTLMELTQIKLNKNITYNDCDFNFYINEITNQLQGVIFEKHAHITLNLEVAGISYPQVYLESILYNLISNALKYTNPEIEPEITISTKLVENKVCLVVKDNGLGIDMKKYRDKLFQLNKVFHKGFDSKGVGLFLTKSQIESLGGTIDVNSEENVGSEFIVTF